MIAQSLSNAGGLRIEWHAHGGLHRIDASGVVVNLFPGSPVEGGPANLWLRVVDGDEVHAVPLLGPGSPLRPALGRPACRQGRWQALELTLELSVAQDAPAWFWHLRVVNAGAAPARLSIVSLQDVGLAAYGAIRLNEHYVSHYLDLAPLQHASQGWVLAARQNLAVGGRHPWLMMGLLGGAAAFATDAAQFAGLAQRAGALPQALHEGLPSRRVQGEHACLALQGPERTLLPGEVLDTGAWGHVLADHPAATGEADLALVDAILALPEASPAPALARGAVADAPPSNLLADSPWLETLDLADDELLRCFGPERRHAEHDGGRLLSFFHGEHAHVVLREKELRITRPHGHILRSGSQLVPDETALTSTAWMGGVFHSMVTQGHVSTNRFLSTARGFAGQFRGTGQRVFVQTGGQWRQLGLPSAFEIEPRRCRWLYRHAQGLIELTSEADAHAPQVTLRVRVLDGAALPLRVLHHVALAGDDGAGAGTPPIARRGEALVVGLPPGSELARRFPGGSFAIEPVDGTRFSAAGGDAALWADGIPRDQPFVVVEGEAAPAFALAIRGELLRTQPPAGAALTLPRWQAPAQAPLANQAAQLAEVQPWFLHNALVHYLAPRGLEQYSGGGWGTRDVCQGPLELLLALGETTPARDLLKRVFAAQNPDGDWPQWFMFFERDAAVRAGDSHGDIVFWPLLALARYLVASGDAALLDEPLPFHGERERLPLWQHAERALAVVRARRVPGTQLAAYGHGDWNDSLQPADPALRERLCSAWTVTLHHQMLTTLARGLQAIGRAGEAAPLAAEAQAVRAEFRRVLLVDGVVAGYALFEEDWQPPQLLLHPRDASTGVAYSLLPMMHAVLEDLLEPEEARAQLALMRRHLVGSDGAHLFDRPLQYRGGPQRIFQRAESAAFFGREIGNMYMHAHLRFAEMLAHLGEAEAFFDALMLAHPVALRERVPSAAPRQANCYYSSSDPAFADRYEAHRDYARVGAGSVALEGGWRIYSSGPGIALALLQRGLLGLQFEHDALVLDPVIPPALHGLTAHALWRGQELQIEYRPGPRGCGVLAVEVNGIDVPFARRANPYRPGAAALSAADVLAALAVMGSGPGPGPAPNRLVVHTG